jgi:PAS domain S-box-containing protein
MRSFIDKIIRGGLYRSIPSDNIIARQRYVLFSIYTGVGVLLYAIFGIGGMTSHTMSYNHFAIFTCVSVTLALNFVMLQVHRYLELGYTISIISGMILIHSFTYEIGGIRNPGLMYLGIIILYSYIVLGNHGGRITLFLSVSNIIYFFVLSEYSEPGIYISYDMDGRALDSHHLISALTSMLIITALSKYLEYAKNITISRIEESKNILEQKNEQLEELSLVASETGNSIMITDDTGKIEWVNDGFTRLTGYSFGESIGRRTAEFLHGPKTDRKIGENLSLCRFDEANFNTEIIKYRKDNTPVWVEENVTRVHDDQENRVKFIFIESDVTERKNAEDRMSEYLRNLESTNKELDKFAYVVSHDLKSPLRAIGNLTDWIEEDSGHLLPEKVRNNFNLVKQRVVRMESLINGILDYSKASKTKTQYEFFDLNDLVNHCYDLLGSPEGYTLKVKKELPTIFADKAKTQQIILNLVGNAIKFNDKKKGIVEIDHFEEEDHYRFSIRDNGPGIDDKFHDKIFKIFQTVNTRDEFESSGVGLAIVKRLIEEENGKVWLESTIGEGTTFHFTLPKSAIDEHEHQKEQQVPEEVSTSTDNK